MKNDSIDCVEMKHKAGRRIYETLKDKSVQEQLEYWKSVAQKFRQRGKEEKKVVSA